MIEYALLVMLGFCAAGLLALLIAPTIWRRAVRLTTKRLDATLPMSLADIEADKDLLRASYAIQIRRLEAGLNKARDKSASQLVEISRLQMVIGEFRDKAATLDKQLEERSNAANVFERTIKKRFPELEAALSAAKAALDERGYEIAGLTAEIRRKEEALSLIQRASSLQQQEIRKLREAMEGGSVDRTGRFKKRPAQWTLEEFRSEYDRLNLELSKMREQLALAHERETGQVAVLKTELQTLAEQIMSAVSAQEKHIAEQRLADAVQPPAREPRAGQPVRRMPAERPGPAPQPWPRAEAPLPRAAEPRAGEARAVEPGPVEAPKAASPNPPQPQAQPAPPAAAAKPDEQPARPKSERSFMRPSERRPSITSEASPAGVKPETASLKSLLTRAAASVPKSGTGEVEAPPAERGAVQVQAPAEKEAAPAKAPQAEKPAVAAERPAPPAAKPAPAAEKPTPAVAVRSDAGQTPPAAPSQPAAGGKEPNLDRMLREIFEGRGNGQPPAQAEATPSTAASSPEPADKSVAAHGDASSKDKSEGSAESESDQEKKQTSLVERLRVV